MCDFEITIQTITLICVLKKRLSSFMKLFFPKKHQWSSRQPPSFSNYPAISSWVGQTWQCGCGGRAEAPATSGEAWILLHETFWMFPCEVKQQLKQPGNKLQLLFWKPLEYWVTSCLLRLFWCMVVFHTWREAHTHKCQRVQKQL